MLEARIGLEIHVELRTRTKLFCACENVFGAAPNTRCCPTCLALPGALPTLNGQAVRLAVRAALALHGRIERVSAFDRKQYAYPDLPKGYQITQYFKPFAVGGHIALPGGQIVRIHHIHLEEDAGKLLHDGDRTLVDFNRCGIPLIEIVTEPDLTSAEDARSLLLNLRETLVQLHITDGKMQEGSLRADVNVSVAEKGAPFGERVELKNISGFRLTKRAIEYEIARQTEVIHRGERVFRETRRWNEKEKRSTLMRDKESMPDYRYMPEPDLPQLVIDDAMILEETERISAYLEAREAALSSAAAEKRAQKATRSAKVVNTDGAPLPDDAEAFIQQILTENPNLVPDYRAGKVKVIAYPMGLFIKRFPDADPATLKKRLIEIFEK